MSRSFNLLRRADQERQPKSDDELSAAPGQPESGPVYELMQELGMVSPESGWESQALLGGDIVEGISAPLHKGAREQVASLVKGLFLMQAASVRAVAMAATEAGTDVAAITVGAAICLSNLCSRRVCLVDADFDHPRLHTYFRPCSPYGLSDVLQEKASLSGALTRVSGNLWVLPAGASTDAPGGHSFDNLMEVISLLRRETDYLVLQSPPLSDTNAAIALANLADGMVLVLEANRTRRDYAQTLKAKLDAANVNVLGAVFNNQTFPIPRSIYSKL